MADIDRGTGRTGACIPGFEIREVVHRSGPRVVYRGRRESDGEPVILKTLFAQYPHRRDVAEIRREFQIARKLSIEGVIRVHSLVTYDAGNVAIEMEPFGISLAALQSQRDNQPLPLERFLSIAIRLARILGRLHEQHVVHMDVVPRNVLVDPASDELRLIDFGISSELTRERPSLVLSKRLQGSLPYISPEQTGRMNRDLDYRTDYYSLGVTCFELLTGCLPFQAENPLEWVHRHISRPPPAAHEIRRDVPEPLGEIVRKLMAKSAEDRYQSTFGLITDLERCRQDLERAGSVASFELGQADVSPIFQVPQTLYGREEELAQLRSLVDDVAHGASGLCLVSGYSGVGKSALVNELGKSIVREKGYLIEGKFDQFQQSSAYRAFELAFRSLAQQLLGESDDRLKQWRRVLQEALRPNGQLIVDLVPEFELVLGRQPDVPELPPTEAQNRFQLVCLNFVKALATSDHPLVVFMDDLQWSDVPTLNLLQRLATARQLSHLLIIGAFRSNQVEASHPLRLTLSEIRKHREIVELQLKPLDPPAVDALTADALHRTPGDVRSLSELIYEKAQGNPFFINELLKNLTEQGQIQFSAKSGRWEWDIAAVRDAQLSDNVVDFMVAGLRRLSKPTQKVLQLAACIGSTFDLETLSAIYGSSPPQTSAALHEALNRNIVIPLNESYKYVGLDDEDAGEPDPSEGARFESADHSGATANPLYRFQHDRVQQAAYALIDEQSKQAVHLSVGRRLLQHCSGEDRDQRLIEIVGHLNAGQRLMEDPSQRRELARMNLEAGIKARRSSAYTSAIGYLRTGRELLPTDDAWDTDYELILEIGREYQHCAYLTGDYAEAEAWAGTILDRARTPLEKAQILSAQTRQYATMGKMRDSMRTAFAGLALLGVELMEDPGPEAVAAEVAAVETHLAGRRIPDLIREPPVTDARAQEAIRLLMEIFPAAFLSGSGDLFAYLVLKSVNISLCHGSSPESAFAYAAYGMLLCGKLNDPAQGHEYGKLAVAMNEKFDDIALKSRIIYVYAMFIFHWSNHWSQMTPWFLKGIEAGYQSGDLLYLAYSAQDCVIWDPALNLETASQEQRKYLTIVKDCEYQDSLDSGTLFLQMQLNFQGLTDGKFSLNDEAFDEQRCVAGMRERRFITGIANYHIYKAEIHFFYDDYGGAMEHVQQQDPLIESVMSLPQLVRFYLVAFLTRSAFLPSMESAQRPAVMQRLHADLRQMSRWSHNCPANFEHLQRIMEAELARLAGRTAEAAELYDRAAAAASTNQFRRDEALANELAAKHLISVGLPRAAEGYLRAARHLYSLWGAHRKVEDLEEKFPHLLRAPEFATATDAASQTLTSSTDQLDSSTLDMISLIKASQAISGEIVLDQLWRTTMQILLENAGAEKGFFVVRQDDQLWIQAKGEAGRASPALAEALPVQPPGGEPLLPVSLVNNVLRTGTALVMKDATQSGRFANDPYIVQHQPQSVICIPILRHGQFEGAIYMENNLTAGVFTEERVEVLKLLSAQASISMENAKLYEDQLRQTEAQRRFVPSQFLESLGHHDIARVGLGEHVAKEMSVLFADLREFTPMVEILGPRAVIELLNDYFSRLGEPIAAAGGFIDSYNGDQLMALFDVPAERAVDAGIAMWRALEEFNRDSLARGGPRLHMGVGLNTGPLVLGTVGRHDRLKCGVVGDTVNLAARIEQLTKAYRACFLISEHTYNSLRDPDRFSIRKVDRVAVKGQERVVTLYEVLDAESPQRRAAKEATRARLVRGMELYFQRDFAAAGEAFCKALEEDPEDAVLSLFAERAGRYTRQAPPPDWQGYESLTHK